MREQAYRQAATAVAANCLGGFTSQVTLDDINWHGVIAGWQAMALAMVPAEVARESAWRNHQADTGLKDDDREKFARALDDVGGCYEQDVFRLADD